MTKGYRIKIGKKKNESSCMWRRQDNEKKTDIQIGKPIGSLYGKCVKAAILQVKLKCKTYLEIS